MFGGTYFPPEDSFGRPGFKTVLRALAAKWEGGPRQRERLQDSAKSILEALKKAAETSLEGESQVVSLGNALIPSSCLFLFRLVHTYKHGCSSRGSDYKDAPPRFWIPL